MTVTHQYIEYEEYDQVISNYTQRKAWITLWEHDVHPRYGTDDIYYKLGSYLYSREPKHWNVAMVF